MALQTSSIPYIYTSCPHHYLCNYLPVSAGRDTLSRSLLRFKHGLQPDLDGWIDCALQLLTPLPISADTIIVRALHHDETIVPDNQPTSLDLLGEALATRFQCQYHPNLLQKSRSTRQSKGLSRHQRRTELYNIYTLEPPCSTVAPPPGSTLAPSTPTATPPGFLIIDDILTTGTTAQMIIRAIRGSYPRSPLRVFTLAKAGTDTQFNYSTPLRGENYQLEQGVGWRVAEEPSDYNIGGGSSPWTGPKLREWILANSF